MHIPSFGIFPGISANSQTLQKTEGSQQLMRLGFGSADRNRSERTRKWELLWNKLPFPNHVKGYVNPLSYTSEERKRFPELQTESIKIYVSDEIGKQSTLKVFHDNPELAQDLNYVVMISPADKCAPGKPYLWTKTELGAKRLKALNSILAHVTPETQRKIQGVGINVREEDREQPVFVISVLDRATKTKLEQLLGTGADKLGNTPWEIEIRPRAIFL